MSPSINFMKTILCKDVTIPFYGLSFYKFWSWKLHRLNVGYLIFNFRDQRVLNKNKTENIELWKSQKMSQKAETILLATW